MPGGTCVPCNCSGNVDPLEAGHCDTVTGECLKCLWNTDGAHCERCSDGFYGDAVTAKNCQGECVSNAVIVVIRCHMTLLTLVKRTQTGGDLNVSCVLMVGFLLVRCRSVLSSSLCALQQLNSLSPLRSEVWKMHILHDQGGGFLNGGGVSWWSAPVLPHPDLLSSVWSLEHRDTVKPLTETVSCLRGPSFGANTGALGICIVVLFRKLYCVSFKHAYNVL